PTVGDDGAGALHHRLPVRVGHVGDQHVTWLHLVHLGHVLNHPHLAGANALADGTAFHQNGALFLEQVALHHGDAGAALHGLGAGLDDVQLAVVPILRPLDVHRTAVVFLDDQRLPGQFSHFLVADAEARTVGAVNFHGLDRTPGLGFFAVDHLDRLAAQVAAQNRRATGLQGRLVHVELVRVDRTLHHGFAQTVGAGDEYHVTEAGLGIQGRSEEHTSELQSRENL